MNNSWKSQNILKLIFEKMFKIFYKSVYDAYLCLKAPLYPPEIVFWHVANVIIPNNKIPYVSFLNGRRSSEALTPKMNLNRVISNLTNLHSSTAAKQAEVE